MVGFTRSSRHVVVAVALLGVLVAFEAPPAGAARDDRPNVIVIVTDDQRWDSLWAMPNVRELLGAHGVTFTNAFVSNPVCCPSRASILTGTYSHTNGVWTNHPSNGGFAAFDESSTLGTWLQGAGYRTGLLGKYLNGYYGPGREGYVPAGWDRWWSFVGGGYFDYSVNDDGALRSYGSAESDYVTDTMADEAVDFIRSSDGPFFLFLTPKAPHLPAVPAPRHADALAGLEPGRPPAWNEADIRDKPRWVRKIDPLDDEKIARLDAKHLDMLRSLLALDDAVARIVDLLEERRALDRTMIVFTSDNGYAWGEHRWDRKSAPYEEVIRVPLVIRYDPLTSGTEETRFALNVDLAPTIAEVVGIEAPGAEGASLVPLLRGDPDVEWRKDFLLEHVGGRVPTYCGVRSPRFTYVYYATGEEELYDLASDPHQLDNLAAEDRHRRRRTRRMDRLRELCTTPPPGLTLPR